MNNMRISTKTLREIYNGEYTVDNFQFIEKSEWRFEHDTQMRWMIIKDKNTNKFYRWHIGRTGNSHQWNYTWDYFPENQEVEEVKPENKLTTVWEKI
jgi:hypothetical protein